MLKINRPPKSSSSFCWFYTKICRWMGESVHIFAKY